jgi:hypothetical protein
VEILNTTLAHTDDYIKDTDAAQVTATVLDDDPAFGATDITTRPTPSATRRRREVTTSSPITLLRRW